MQLNVVKLNYVPSIDPIEGWFSLAEREIDLLITMENYASCSYQYSSHRGVAMVLALVSAIVLSPLYVDRGKKESSYYETRWSCGGIVLPVLLAGLIVAIRSTSSSSSLQGGRSSSSIFGSPEPSTAPRIGSSSWGLAAVLVMLLCVLSWQTSMQHYLWK